MIRRALVAIGLAGLVAAVAASAWRRRHAAPVRRLARALRPRAGLTRHDPRRRSSASARSARAWPASSCRPTSTRSSIRDDSVSRAELVARSLGDGRHRRPGRHDRSARRRRRRARRPRPGAGRPGRARSCAPGSTWCRPATTSTTSGRCSTSTTRPASGVCTWWSGAGFAPGLTCVLAAHGAARFDQVDEIHVAKSGTGGPACARQHHRAARPRAPRLARRRLGAAPRRLGPRAVLVPRSDRRPGLLPGRAARRAGAGARPSPASSGSRPGCRPPAATASPPGCRCCGPPTPRAGPARCASSCAACAGLGPRRRRPRGDGPTGRRRRCGRPRWRCSRSSSGALRRAGRGGPGRAGRARCRSSPSWPGGA